MNNAYDPSKYKHPYITIQIFDNTEFIEDEEAEIRRPFNGMQVGFFAGGRGNKLQYMYDRTRYLREFGKPNYKLLGQAAYNVDNALATDNCGMYVMALKPETATFANIVIMVRFKVVGVQNESSTDTGESDTTPTTRKSGYYNKDEGFVYVLDDSSAGFTPIDVMEPDVELQEGVADYTSLADLRAAAEAGNVVLISWTSNDELTAKTTAINNGEEITDEDSGTDTDDDTEEVLGPKLVYSFYPKYIENATTEEELLAAANSLMSEDPDEEGFINMPLLMFYSLGTGVYGNDIHLQLENVTEYIQDVGLTGYTFGNWLDYENPEMHSYTLIVMEPGDSGLVTREKGTGTFDEDGFDASTEYYSSSFMEDVINDLETGSQRIKSKVFLETYQAMCDVYNTTIDPTKNFEPKSMDIFTGLDLEGNAIENLDQETTRADYINMFSVDGFTLQKGNDGWDDMTQEEVINKRNELLIKAYAGDIDPYIKSRFSTPCNFNLDAGYDIAVKKQMAALANLRKYDLMTYLDCGTPATVNGLLLIAGQLRGVYGYNVVKEAHSYKFRDYTYTGKVCQATITHWLAQALPNHNASQYTILGLPLARDQAILVSGRDYIRGTFLPVIEPDADDLKETLYRLRVNCYETLAYNSVQRSTAITSCQSNSDRLLEMNEYILQKVVDTAYKLLASKLYKLGEAADRARYEEDAKDILMYQVGNYVRSASLEFEMTTNDEKKSLLRLKVHIVYKTVVQRGELEIYLDPRVEGQRTKLTITR